MALSVPGEVCRETERGRIEKGMGSNMRLGALEAGGTKMVCAIGDEKGNIYEQVSISTESPEITIPRLLAFFQDKDIEADYIAQALTGYILTLSPNMIILGGGVMHQEQLFPLIRPKVTEYLGGYIKTEELEDMEHYIVPASLHDDQGIMGCLELARRALAD